MALRTAEMPRPHGLPKCHFVMMGMSLYSVHGLFNGMHTGATLATGAQLALTPFNHSPVTARGREIVARARSQTPHLVASSPVASRTPSPSRVRTFMQGRTRPASSPSSRITPPGATQPSSASRVVAVELASGAPSSAPPPSGLQPRGAVS
jgi:hypothetical protein